MIFVKKSDYADEIYSNYEMICVRWELISNRWVAFACHDVWYRHASCGNEPPQRGDGRGNSSSTACNGNVANGIRYVKIITCRCLYAITNCNYVKDHFWFEIILVKVKLTKLFQWLALSPRFKHFSNLQLEPLPYLEVDYPEDQDLMEAMTVGNPHKLPGLVLKQLTWTTGRYTQNQ